MDCKGRKLYLVASLNSDDYTPLLVFKGYEISTLEYCHSPPSSLCCTLQYRRVTESDMLRAELRKEKFRTRIGWIDNGPGRGSYSSIDVEILHKDFLGSYDIKTIFLNPILMWVSCVLTIY